MIAVRRIQIGEADLFKRLRLASLQDAPYAFSSTYESALHRSAESWQEQADYTAQGADRATFIAFSDDAPIGITALYRLPGQADVGELIQMWVAPEHRGKHVAWDPYWSGSPQIILTHTGMSYRWLRRRANWSNTGIAPTICILLPVYRGAHQ